MDLLDEYKPLFEFIGILVKEDFSDIMKKYEPKSGEIICLCVRNAKTENMMRNVYLTHINGRMKYKLEHPGKVDIFLYTDTETIKALLKRERLGSDYATNQPIMQPYGPRDAIALKHVFGTGSGYEYSRILKMLNAWDEMIERYNELAKKVEV